MKYFILLSAFLGMTVTAFAHGMSEADQAIAIAAGPVEFIQLGALHMLTGYDHLLFLFGVMFFLTSFKDIVKFITAFTIGHSITLVFATLLQIRANYYLIDAVIALTVCYKAFDNLDGFKKYLGTASPNLLGAVFGFGLIHGFGLSTRLQQLPLGHDNLVLKILSFNVGVELGQIAALLVMGVILNQWRHTASFEKFSKAANIGLMIMGALLFLMQIHGYQHSSHSHDLASDQVHADHPPEAELTTPSTSGHNHGHDHADEVSLPEANDHRSDHANEVPIVETDDHPHDLPNEHDHAPAETDVHTHDHGSDHEH